MSCLSRRGLSLVAAGLLATPGLARAQAGTVRIIVPFNPGGISGILARSLAQQLTVALGNTVMVENRAGANGSIGAGVAARAQAAVPEHTTPAALAALVRAEQEAWGAVVRSENIRLD